MRKTIREITVKTNPVAGNRLKAALAVMAFSIMHCSMAFASDAEPSAIDNTMTCFREQGLQFSDLTRRQNNPAYRTVQTTQGTEKVSVTDGVRFFWSAAGQQIRIKLHLEQSANGQIASDADIIAREYQKFGATPETMTRNITPAITELGLRNPVLGKGLVGVHSLISAKRQQILTMYINWLPAQDASQDNEAVYSAAMSELLTKTKACL